MKKIRCQKCHKSKVKLLVNSTSAKGVKNYLCRKCNTQRCQKYRATPNGKERIYNAVKKSIGKHTDRQGARYELNDFLRKGKILKPKTCMVCSRNTKLVGHHTDYSKPLEVIWVCVGCHANIHRDFKLDK